MDEPIFEHFSVIKMDHTTGRIAMVLGGFHDERDHLPIGHTRAKAEEIAHAEIGKHKFPNFRGGYQVSQTYLSEKQRLIIAICDPLRGIGPVPEETIEWCEEHSIISNTIPELG